MWPRCLQFKYKFQFQFDVFAGVDGVDSGFCGMEHRTIGARAGRNAACRFVGPGFALPRDCVAAKDERYSFVSL